MSTALTSIETFTAPFNLSHRKRVGFLYAHPDDELMTGTGITTAQDAGAHVTIVVATNGEASSRGDKHFLKSGGRLRESTAAFATYGISEADIVYFGLRDGQLTQEFAQRRLRRCLEATIATHALTTLVTTGYDGYDGHDDHRAVHEAALAAADEETEVWGLNQNGSLYLPADPQRKLGAAYHHSSQFKIERTVLGAFAIHPDSEADIQPYHDLLYRGETYQQYNP